MSRRRPAARGARTAAAVALALGAALRPVPGTAQDPAPADTVTADTVAVDTLAADTLAADTIPADSLRLEPFPADIPLGPEEGAPEEPPSERIQAFPERSPAALGFASPVFECERSCLLSSTAFSLLELLLEHVPGLVPLRAGYFGGPHHAVAGPLLPASLRVVLDGHELAPLEAGQIDLLRVSLVYLEAVRVVRSADGIVIHAESHRQERPEAYTRILAGTGQPDLQLLRAIFTNRLGRAFTIGGGFDLLNVRERLIENDRFEFWGRVSWMPGGNRAGVELEFRSEDLFRTTSDTVDFGRRTVLLRTRADLADWLQLEARGSVAEFRSDTTDGTATDTETLRDVDRVAVALSAATGGFRGHAEVRLTDGDAHPRLAGQAGAAVRPVGPFRLEAGARLGRWDGFDTHELRGGAALHLGPGDLFVLRGDASTGVRGVPRPLLDEADSVSYDAVAASAEIRAGPYRLRGRWSWEEVGRVLPIGAPFDRALEPGPPLEVVAYEVGLAGPVLPLGAIIPGLAPIRVDGYWRRHEPTGELPLYLPEDLVGGEVALHDDFFEGNLEIWLSVRLLYRTDMLSAQATVPEALILPSYRWWQGHVGFRIGDFRFTWKVVNPAGLEVSEVGEVPFPTQLNVVSVNWEFFN